LKRLLIVILVAVMSHGAHAVEKRSDAARGKKPAGEKSASQVAWDDLRFLMTAVEAYGTDNDSVYAAAAKVRQGPVGELRTALDWYYANTVPHKNAPPQLDPWGREYRFVISDSGKLYAIYSLGVDGKLDREAETFLDRLAKDAVTPEELQKTRVSNNTVVSGGVIFAPEEVVRTLKK
jgi:hypothetical protein